MIQKFNHKVGRVLMSRVAAMGIGSLMFQGANLLLILILKGVLDANGFSNIITQIAWASILGSIATFRLELLSFQQRGRFIRADMVFLLTFTVLFLAVMGSAISGGAALLGLSPPIVVVTLFLALGLGLHEAQSFICVQTQRIPQLLLTRFTQATAIVAAGLCGWYRLEYEWVFLAYAAAVTVPLVIWFGILLIRLEVGPKWQMLAPATFGRGLYLALSTFTNAVYVNIAVLIAAATQSIMFVAEFGFIMRLLTGPITTIRQAFAHTYLAGALALDIADPATPATLWRITLRAIIRSVSLYMALQVVIMALLFVFADSFQLERPQMAFVLMFATIAQVGVNTVSGVRTVLKSESAFLRYDIVRALVLSAGLSAPLGLPFSFVFAAISFALYGGYLWFIRRQIQQLHPVV